MKLYDLKAGMNPRRVRIYLAEKGIEVPSEAVDMMKGENRTPEFLRINPLGTLPVLELDDGTVLTESVAICRYVEALKPEPNLFGRDPLEQARVEMWNRRAEIELMRPLVEQFRQQVLPMFTTRNVVSTTTCIPNQESGSLIDLKFDSFTALPAAGAAR